MCLDGSRPTVGLIDSSVGENSTASKAYGSVLHQCGRDGDVVGVVGCATNWGEGGLQGGGEAEAETRPSGNGNSNSVGCGRDVRAQHCMFRVLW